jgi:hypothetical protein
MADFCSPRKGLEPIAISSVSIGRSNRLYAPTSQLPVGRQSIRLLSIYIMKRIFLFIIEVVKPVKAVKALPQTIPTQPLQPDFTFCAVGLSSLSQPSLDNSPARTRLPSRPRTRTDMSCLPTTTICVKRRLGEWYVSAS